MTNVSIYMVSVHVCKRFILPELIQKSLSVLVLKIEHPGLNPEYSPEELRFVIPMTSSSFEVFDNSIIMFIGEIRLCHWKSD